jgi:hypothetical protein
VLVASLTAVNKVSHSGSAKFRVKAESTIRPLTCTPKSTFRMSPCFKSIRSNRNVNETAGKQTPTVLTLLVSCVRGVMSSYFVHAETGRKPDSALQSTLLDQRSRSVLDHLGDLCHAHSRFDVVSSVQSNLSVYLGGSTDVTVGGLGIGMCRPL